MTTSQQTPGQLSPAIPERSRRQQIRDHVVLTLGKVEGLSPEQVRISPVIPREGLGGEVLAFVVTGSDTGRRQDDTIAFRTMKLAVGLVVRIDPLSADPQTDQLDQVQSRVQAALETLVRNNVGGLAVRMDEDPGLGLVMEGLDDADSYAFASTAWTVEYTRTFGSIN